MPGLEPKPWQPTETQIEQALAAISQVDGGFDTHWFSDRLNYGGHDQVLGALQARGAVTVYRSPAPVVAILPAAYQDGMIRLTAIRAIPGPAGQVSVLAQGRDPAGTMRVLHATLS